MCLQSCPSTVMSINSHVMQELTCWQDAASGWCHNLRTEWQTRWHLCPLRWHLQWWSPPRTLAGVQGHRQTERAEQWESIGRQAGRQALGPHRKWPRPWARLPQYALIYNSYVCNTGCCLTLRHMAADPLQWSAPDQTPTTHLAPRAGYSVSVPRSCGLRRKATHTIHFTAAAAAAAS